MNVPARKILVVGGAGFIGATTAHHLAAAGYEPVIFDDLSRGHASFVTDFPLVEGDVLDVEAVATALETQAIEAVLHFAALIEVGESVRDPLTYYRSNVTGTLCLLEAMQRQGVRRLVFSSSAAVYGTPAYVPIDEAHRVAPINPYGRTKAMMEEIIADCGVAWDLSWIALRYFNAAGADTSLPCGEWHEPESHLIPNALRAAAGLQPALALFGTDHPTPDGTAIRDYIHVADLAAAHVAAVDKLFASDEPIARPFNLGNGEGFSVREVIAAVERASGKTVPVEEKPIRAGDPARLVANASAARRELGWTPRHRELEEIVASAWLWFNKHGFSPTR